MQMKCAQINVNTIKISDTQKKYAIRYSIIELKGELKCDTW